MLKELLKDYEPFDFPDEDLIAVSHDEEESSEKTCWKLYFDEASNALGHGVDAILITLEGEYYPFTTRLDFNCTKNVTEYKACAMGLQAIIEKWVKELKYMGIQQWSFISYEENGKPQILI